MLLKNTESNARPSGVLLDRYESGAATVRLASNIREEERPREGADGEETQVVYVYDEVLFTLGPDRQDTVDDIQRNFDAWWAYGCEPEETAPTIEERIGVLEDAVMEIVEILVGGGEG